MTLEFSGGNQLQLLTNGRGYFPALRQAIDAARSEIYLETYIFADDHTGRGIAAALVARRRTRRQRARARRRLRLQRFVRADAAGFFTRPMSRC